ncbi:prelamin-A/C-like [Saccostrea echinata]|uniref:prelamin-A/C-like n=1 Tax=Saccostrea echinata TaxID=191078 RepID=UPI002A8333F6|nr:prelamin-A/C-like [Saccostrea echinata]
MATPTKSKPSTSGGTSPGRRARQASPARISRQEEKSQLQNLNDRLAAYIDRIRNLETENSRLLVQVRSSEETVTREVSSVKSMYEKELEDARRVLDDTAKEKARLQIENGKLKADADEWKGKFKKRDREAKDAENTAQRLQKENSDLQSRTSDAEAARKALDTEVNNLRGEIATLESQLAHAKKQLEDETLLRVDLQNRLQSSKEELQFKSQMYEQQLSERSVKTTTEYDDVDSALREEYESKMQEALQEMREKHDQQLQEVRAELELIHERQVGNLKSALDRSMSGPIASTDEIKITRRRVDELSSEVTKLKKENAALEAQVLNLQSRLGREQEEFEERLALKDQEISDLRAAMEEQSQEYADILEVKIKLDNEITTYRKLLETEEERLNMSQTSSPGSTPGSRRGHKRKRVALSQQVQEFESHSTSGFSAQSDASGNVNIEEIDTDGKFIRLHNTSHEDVAVGTWQLQLRHSEADDAENKAQYKFHHSLQIKAGQMCTVWSSGTGQTHNPPTDLVMKGTKWIPNKDVMVCVLVNSDGEEVARRTMTKKIQRITTSSYRPLSGSETDGSGRAGSDRCSIM